MPKRLTSFQAEAYRKKHGRCPKGFTASRTGRCEKQSPFERRHMGPVRGRGKGRRAGLRRYLARRGGISGIIEAKYGG